MNCVFFSQNASSPGIKMLDGPGSPGSTIVLAIADVLPVYLARIGK
jgi:hypothetical protein